MARSLQIIMITVLFERESGSVPDRCDTAADEPVQSDGERATSSPAGHSHITVQGTVPSFPAEG